MRGDRSEIVLNLYLWENVAVGVAGVAKAKLRLTGGPVIVLDQA